MLATDASVPLRLTPIIWLCVAVSAVVGCQSSRRPFVSRSTPASPAIAAATSVASLSQPDTSTTPASPSAGQPAALQQTAFQTTSPAANSVGDAAGSAAGTAAPQLPPPSDRSNRPEVIRPEVIAAPEATDPTLSLAPFAMGAAGPSLTDVVGSVRNHFPLIRQAAAGRVVASGEALAAAGAFDRKFDSFTNVQPLDFYENHWHKSGIKRNTMWGGQLGAGYKLGRGSFEPWYKERETNDLGEFSISLLAPIGRDVRIDSNRAELWRAQLERGRIEPLIRLEVIEAVRQGVRAYWEWVAAAANLRIAEEVLELGVKRVGFLERQVKLGEKARIDIVDNRRIIVTRQAKVIDARRKLEQSTVKLSLFLRDPAGQPVLLDMNQALAEFPEIMAPDEAMLDTDVDYAIANRPELDELAVVRRQLGIAMQQAGNETRPDVDGGLLFAQDAGNPTSSDDKSEFEIEATLMVSVPLERRKALGKLRQLRGKFAQLRAKTQFTADKIAIEVRSARAAMTAAIRRVEQTREGVDLAQQMAAAEDRLYREGQSNLFNLNLREKQTADAQTDLVLAQLDFFVALADYTAALGLDGGSLDMVYAEPGTPPAAAPADDNANNEANDDAANEDAEAAEEAASDAANPRL